VTDMVMADHGEVPLYHLMRVTPRQTFPDGDRLLSEPKRTALLMGEEKGSTRRKVISLEGRFRRDSVKLDQSCCEEELEVSKG
jgi:hypothetical protein